jgi:hypothetical protein
MTSKRRINMAMRDQVVDGVEAILAEYGSGGQLEMSDVPRVLMLAACDDQMNSPAEFEKPPQRLR